MPKCTGRCCITPDAILGAKHACESDLGMQGWCWEDDDWHIDMAGLESHAVDAEGWSYAVDYPWLTAPPTPGSGRCRKVSAHRPEPVMRPP